MFEPMDFGYASVIVLDSEMVEAYKAYLETQGQHVDVISMTRKELQESILAGYLYSTNQTN